MSELYRTHATYVTPGGHQGSAEFTLYADTLADADLQTRVKIINDGRRRYAGKLDVTCERLNP